MRDFFLCHHFVNDNCICKYRLDLLTKKQNKAQPEHCLPWSQKSQMPEDLFPCSLWHYLYEQSLEKAVAVQLWLALLKHIQCNCITEAFSACLQWLGAVYVAFCEKPCFLYCIWRRQQSCGWLQD